MFFGVIVAIIISVTAGGVIEESQPCLVDLNTGNEREECK